MVYYEHKVTMHLKDDAAYPTIDNTEVSLETPEDYLRDISATLGALLGYGVPLGDPTQESLEELWGTYADKARDLINYFQHTTFQYHIQHFDLEGQKTLALVPDLNKPLLNEAEVKANIVEVMKQLHDLGVISNAQEVEEALGGTWISQYHEFITTTFNNLNK